MMVPRSVAVPLACGLITVACSGRKIQVAPEPGEEVRVTWDERTSRLRRETGTLGSIGTYELTFETTDSDSVRVLLEQLVDLQVRTGTRPLTFQGGGVGLLAGMIAGALVGPSLFCDSDPCSEEPGFILEISDKEASRLEGATWFGLGGAVVGLIVGSRFRVAEWSSVSLEVIQASGSATRAGGALRLQMSF